MVDVQLGTFFHLRQLYYAYNFTKKIFILCKCLGKFAGSCFIAERKSPNGSAECKLMVLYMALLQRLRQLFSS